MLEIRHAGGQNTATTQKSYDSFYSKQGFSIRDSFYLWYLELMQLQKNEILLDVACGKGRLVQLAVQHGIQALGVDFSKEGVYAGRGVEDRGGWFAGDGEFLPVATQSVDCVASIGSLEHYQNPAKGIAEIVRVLKPRGRAYILLPNAFGLLGNIAHVYRTGEIFDDAQPLQRYATMATWQALLEQNGFSVAQVIPWGEVNLPRTRLDWLWTIRRPQKLIRLLLAWNTPANLANQLIFVCRPRGATANLMRKSTVPSRWE